MLWEQVKGTNPVIINHYSPITYPSIHSFFTSEGLETRWQNIIKTFNSPNCKISHLTFSKTLLTWSLMLVIAQKMSSFQK